jgi:RHS repeat-associated protein
LGDYFYDGDGKRVKKVVPNGETTIFVYDASGKSIAEYSTLVEPTATAKTSYLTNDHLGSTRIITNQTGDVQSRRDFMPFGEEILSSQRISQLGYNADNIRQKFTSYERDAETDLDFAQARMYHKNHGRFTSVDPTLKSVSFDEPQTWNRYVYVTNNPLRFVDPLGLWKLEYTNVYKDVEVEEDGKKVIKKVFVGVQITAVKTKDTDNAARLLEQLKIDKNSEQGKQLLAAIGNSETVRLSALPGEVGDSFDLYEGLLTVQKIFTDNGGRGGPSVAGYQNCAETCARTAFPGQSFNGDFYGSPDYIDSLLKDQKNLSQSELQFKDVVRFADGANNGTHYANAIFENDDKSLEAFSRSGQGGKLEIIDVTKLSGNPYNYGAVRGIGKDSTGFYSRSQKRGK